MPFDLDPEVNPQMAPEPEPEPAPAPEPDANAAALRQAEEARTAAEQRAREAEERNNQLFSAYDQVVRASRQPTPQRTYEPEPLPDRDEDPDAYMEAKIQREVDNRLTQQVQPVVQQQQGINQLAIQNAIELQRNNMRSDTTNFPGYKEHEAEINEYAKHFQPDELARPQALQECYYRVMGRVAAREARERSMADNHPEGGGRQSGAGEHLPDPDANASDAERRAAARAGMTVKQFKAMQGAGSVSLEEFRASMGRK